MFCIGHRYILTFIYKTFYANKVRIQQKAIKLVRKKQQMMSIWIKLAAKSRVNCEQNAVKPATAELINRSPLTQTPAIKSFCYFVKAG